MLNDNIAHFDALLTKEDGTIFVWTMSNRGREWLQEHYRACCGSPGNCGCGVDEEKERWELGTKRETWLTPQHSSELIEFAAASGLNIELLHVSREPRRIV